ncbi:MAG: peptide ABC transporter [Chloroflexi bacterium]|nr:MAG: peptide ABC transporter [Chloroflexota bacterium]
MFVVVRDLFRYNGSFRVGFMILLLIVTLVILSFFSPYGEQQRRVAPRNEPPSLEHPLGTNSLGQDLFWQVTFAIRNSLIVAGTAVVIGRSIAVALGSFAGYSGGWIDRVLSSITDSFIVIPRLPLIILISFILKGNLTFIELALFLGLLDWAWPSKRYRSQILTLREEEFTNTAVYSGMRTPAVILREHIPFLIPFLLADMVSGFLWAVGMEITLSSFGLSELDRPSLGTMIYWANYYQALLTGKYWWLVAPILSSILIVVSFYLISTSLTEYLDPRTRLKRLEARAAG